MWCSKCQSEVAGQASLDNQRLQCTACGSDLAVGTAEPAGSPPGGARSARDLLARWAREEPLELPAVAESQHRTDREPTGSADPAGREHRFDPPQPLERSTQERSAEPGSERSARPLRTERSVPRRDRGLRRRRHAHAEIAAPHLPLPLQKSSATGPRNGTSLLGLLLAYLGVGTLTFGAVLVILGYFGTSESYAPTGWLIVTVGQMLLFLGVVTLVSGGLEQTVLEVSQRVETVHRHLWHLRRQVASRSPAAETDEESFDNDPPVERATPLPAPHSRTDARVRRPADRGLR